MGNERRGIRRALSPARKFIVELMHHARKVPTLAHSRRMNVASLAAARSGARIPLTWPILFMKAYGLMAAARPEFRQSYLPWPWPHLYEHPISECALLVERQWQGEPVVLAAKIRGPETTPLEKLAEHVHYFKTAPVEEVAYFRQILRVGGLPRPLRRLAFWNGLYLSGYRRAKHLGTFALSSLGNLGCEQDTVLTPLTTYLTFGPVSRDGSVTARVIYDHRVMDGRTVARGLEEVEMALHGEVLDEVRQLTELRPLDRGLRLHVPPWAA